MNSGQHFTISADTANIIQYRQTVKGDAERSVFCNHRSNL